MTVILSVAIGFMGGMLAFHLFAEKYLIAIERLMVQTREKIFEVEERLDYLFERVFDLADKIEEN